MLECSHLLLKPWTEAGPPESPPDQGPVGRRRDILDADNDQAVGFAWEPESVPVLSWLMPPILEVHEREDSPLLCTVRRTWGWGPRWEVRDADDNLRGTFYPAASATGGLASAGSPLGVKAGAICPMLIYPYAIEPAQSGIGMPLEEFAAVTSEADGIRLEFQPILANNPFTRMVVLAAVLRADG